MAALIIKMSLAICHFYANVNCQNSVSRKCKLSERVAYLLDGFARVDFVKSGL